MAEEAADSRARPPQPRAIVRQAFEHLPVVECALVTDTCSRQRTHLHLTSSRQTVADSAY